MGDSTISQLPSVITVGTTDYLPLDQGGVTKKAQAIQFYSQFTTPTGSSLVGFKNTLPNCIQTTVEKKLQQVINLIDYPVVMDGVTDDYAGFHSALSDLNNAGGGSLVLPAKRIMLGTPLSLHNYNNVHIIGSGIGATILTKNTNFVGASIRFYSGSDNSIENLTLDCNGYDGRGIYFQDLRSFTRNVAVLNCPDRPFGLNGGGDTTYGLDVNGYNSDDPGWDGVPVFYPAGCKILNCRAYNSGRTALSQKQMPYSEIAGNIVETSYSEGITADGYSNYTKVHDNHLVNVSISNGTTAFPDKVNGGYLTIGTGGVGGIGIDENLYGVFYANSIVHVQPNLATGFKTLPGINFKNSLGVSNGVKVFGNTIEDVDLGIKMLSVATGAAANNYNHIVTGNTFVSVITDLQIDSGNTGIQFLQNRAPTSTLAIVDNGTNNINDINDGDGTDFTVQLQGGSTPGVATYSDASSNRLWWTRKNNRMDFNYYFSWTAHTGTGQLQATGLPYANNSGTHNTPGWACEVNGLTVTGQVYAHPVVGASILVFFIVNNGTKTNLSVPASGEIHVSGSYYCK